MPYYASALFCWSFTRNSDPQSNLIMQPRINFPELWAYSWKFAPRLSTECHRYTQAYCLLMNFISFPYNQFPRCIYSFVWILLVLVTSCNTNIHTNVMQLLSRALISRSVAWAYRFTQTCTKYFMRMEIHEPFHWNIEGTLYKKLLASTQALRIT